jgi:tRNA pseudouridine38-40 synthase
MVRILMGTLLEVGMGQRSAESMPEILAAGSREMAGPLVPAKGLMLMEVYY